MSAPERHPIVLAPPHPNMTKEEWDFHHKTIYERTGGPEAATVNLKGLNASVDELNTLVGITTSSSSTVQKQLNAKVNIADIGTIASQDADNVAISGGSISGTSIQSRIIKIEAGTTSSFMNVGGTLQVDTTTAGNGAGVETDLISYSIAANTLSQDNVYLEVTAFGTVAANANNKEIKLFLGTSTLLATGSVAANAGSWAITSKIIRTGSATEKCISSIVSDNTLIIDSATYFAGTESWVGGLVIKCTGNGVANDDVVQEGLIIKWNKL